MIFIENAINFTKIETKYIIKKSFKIRYQKFYPESNNKPELFMSI